MPGRIKQKELQVGSGAIRETVCGLFTCPV